MEMRMVAYDRERRGDSKGVLDLYFKLFSRSYMQL